MVALIPLQEPPTTRELLIEQNDTRQARVRLKLARLGGELKRVKTTRAAAGNSPERVWAVPGITRDLRVEIRPAETELAIEAADAVVAALQSCGFTARIVKDKPSQWDNVHVESRAEEAAAAMMIQGAFKVAGFSAGLTIHDRAAAKRIVVHVGSRGLT